MSPARFQLRLRSAGMFSNVNEVVHQLHLAALGNYQFRINWRASCYLEPEKGGEPWLYYFENCFDSDQWPGDLPRLSGGKAIACCKNNLITPRLKEGQCAPLLLPQDRHLPAKIIRQYIKPNQATSEIIQQHLEKFTGRYVIGLHIRGLGRNHGGAASILRRHGRGQLEMDYDRFFAVIDKRINQQPDAAIFVCSDSLTVINHVVKTYGERVISYPASRSDFGEMHAGHANNQGFEFSPYKLGQDVMVEAHLLANTDFFVHGNSNVANFVLCKNPNLDSVYVYQQEIQEVIDRFGG